MTISSGLLVAFEGIDGSGKTTQVSLLKAWAEKAGLEVVSTKEPTNGVWGRRIRDSAVTQRLPPQEELEAFVHDRREHVVSLILPALERGALVIVDRYYYSSVAYQGARGLDPKAVLKLNRAFAPIPDLVFLLDLDPKTGLEQVSQRGVGRDLFETLEELSNARAIFQELSKSERHLITLDARMKIQQVHHAVVCELVRGPLFSRMAQLGQRLKIPGADPAYALLGLAKKLADDPSLATQEKVRRLWVADQGS